MADDELLVEIAKDFWPKGVLRALNPALRSLGEKHGNMVLAAQPTKGMIMVRGDPKDIESAKPALLALIQEYFPDAPLPVALGGKEEQQDEEMAEEEEEEAMEEAPPAPAPPARAPVAPKPAAPAQPAAPASAAQKPASSWFSLGRSKPASASAAAPPPAETAGEPEAQVTCRRLRPSFGAPPPLLWECIRKSSSFTRKATREAGTIKAFTSEPRNLMGFHAYRFSGLATTDALDIRPIKNGCKESIELVQSHAKMSHLRRPKTASVTTGLHKCPKRGLRRLAREIDAKFYRRGLYALARLKYMKVQQSFKTKRRHVRSRRARPKA